MATIGLYVYRIWAHKESKPDTVMPLWQNSKPGKVVTFVNYFLGKRKNNLIDKEAERKWRLELENNSPTLKEGIVKYGAFGIDSVITEVNSEKVLFERKNDQSEEFPLYFQFWLPKKGGCGLLVLQSYKGRSCNSMIINSMKEMFSDTNKGTILKISKIAPIQDEKFRRSKVQKLTFLKRRMPADAADALKGLDPKEFNVELSLTPSHRTTFGLFSEVERALQGKVQNGSILIDGTEFTHATASVKVGDSYRRVGVLGPDANYGVIDVTDEILFDSDKKPKYNSISKEAQKITKEYAVALGLNR